MKTYMKPFLIASVATLTLLSSGCSEAQSQAQSVDAVADQTVTTSENAAQIDAPQKIAKANWDIVAEGSHIQFTAQQEGQDFTGSFTEFTGDIAFDPDAPETGRVEISIPLGSVDAGSRDRNSTLPAKVWFSVKKFPTAIFISDQISRDGDGYLAKGTLTLKGKSAPVDLPFTLSVEGNRAVMNGSVMIDRTTWNVGSDPWNTDEWVSTGVKLNIQVTANRAK